MTVERVVDKLLHAPTVRVKELAEEPGGDSYAEALRELFALDPFGNRGGRPRGGRGGGVNVVRRGAAGRVLTIPGRATAVA